MEDELEIAIGDEEFYEKIEAPKFVDFTAPDRYRSDDGFWFCLRVGCDRKHEEEIDHEAISKDFVLRVMAARSPNVRLRKVLNRNTSSIKNQCALSAPAKPTKSRLSKLAVISSIPQKIIDTKPKIKPISERNTTPKQPKGRQVTAKYLTTPRHKVCPSNTNKSFRSVQNPKPTNIEVPNNKIIAKALFKSPKKKGICVKTSAELRQRKRVLGYSSKSLKEINTRGLCKDKSKGSSLLKPLNNSNEHKSKPSILKKKSIEIESSDVEIDTDTKFSERNNTKTKETKEISEENLEVKNEEIENDDKENYVAPDCNRSSGRKPSGRSETTKMNKKVVTIPERDMKEGTKPAVAGAQIVKYKKPRPTNPKPFRLRTDERGILREANVEKRASMKETDAVFNRRNENEIEKQKTPAEKGKGPPSPRQKVSTTTTPQRRSNVTKQCKKEREILGEISEKSTRKPKPPSLQPHFMTPIGGASTRKTTASDVKDVSSIKAGERQAHSSRSTNVHKKSSARTVA